MIRRPARSEAVLACAWSSQLPRSPGRTGKFPEPCSATRTAAGSHWRRCQYAPRSLARGLLITDRRECRTRPQYRTPTPAGRSALLFRRGLASLRRPSWPPQRTITSTSSGATGLTSRSTGSISGWKSTLGARLTGSSSTLGLYDGVVISNTYYFEQIGWRGVLVEPNSRKATLCRENRPRSHVFECAAVSSSDIEQITLIDVPGGEVYSSTVGSDFNAQRLRDYGLTATEVSVPARTT